MNTKLYALVKKEFVWSLDEYPCTIAGVVFTTACTPVLHVFKHCQRISNVLVRLVPFDICHEPNSTGIMLKMGGV